MAKEGGKQRQRAKTLRLVGNPILPHMHACVMQRVHVLLLENLLVSVAHEVIQAKRDKADTKELNGQQAEKERETSNAVCYHDI